MQDDRGSRVYVVEGVRTTFLRSGTGFADLRSYDLGRHAMTGLLARIRFRRELWRRLLEVETVPLRLGLPGVYEGPESFGFPSENSIDIRILNRSDHGRRLRATGLTFRSYEDGTGRVCGPLSPTRYPGGRPG